MAVGSMFRILTRSSIRNSQRLTLSHHAKVLRWQKRQRGSLILRALPYSEKTVIKALGIFALGAGAAVYNSVDSSNTFISLPPATSARYNQHCQCEAPPNDLENNAPSFNLKDHYELTQVLGEGGFGMVYRALRKSDGVSVALKTLPRADTG